MELLEMEAPCFPVEKYVNSTTHILHECVEGHQWSITPKNVLKGRSCPVCSGRNIDYKGSEIAIPLEPYIKSNVPIKHRFICGHEYSIEPNKIQQGRGCKFCSTSGFKADKPAILYFVKIENLFYKLGITNRTTKERLAKDIKEYNIEIMWELEFPLGKDARDLERHLLEKYKKYLENTGLLNSGNTETLNTYIPKPNL